MLNALGSFNPAIVYAFQILPTKPKLKWFIHRDLEQLDELIVESNYVLTVFGVSFFEVLQYGIPTVVFSPYGKKDDIELKALKNEEVAVISQDADEAILDLIHLMKDNNKARIFSKRAVGPAIPALQHKTSMPPH